MLTTEQIDRLLSQGANVLSGDGEKIGSIGQVFVDNEDGQPSWVTVRTGLFGISESFVPLEGAREEGNDIVVPYSKNQVKDAPRIDADRPLEPAEEDRLYQHYQLDTGRTYAEATADTADSTPDPGTQRTGTPTATDDAPAPAAQDTTAPDRSAPATAARTPGYDTTAPATNDAPAPATQDTTAPDRSAPATAARTPGYDTTAPATQDTTAPDRDAAPAAQDTTAPDRSAPATAARTPGYDTTAPATNDAPAPAAQDTTATEQPAAGGARLRKYVTTEYVTRTVPVQREEVRIEREPIPEENRGDIADRADDENEVILHEERIIVTKETVPVERVHIGTETVTEDVTIKEKVRKEHIDTEGPEESGG